MIFADFKVDALYQVGEKARIDCSQTFLSPDEAAITAFEIEPEAGAGFQNVLTDRYLDWQYSTAGDKVVTLRVTTDGAPTTATVDIEIVTAATDMLWSKDVDLLPYEPDILGNIPAGRSTFNMIHRRAQSTILTTLDERKIWNRDTGARFEKDALVNVTEVKDWSIALVLMYIFEGLSNAVGDIFDLKAKKYASMVEARAARAFIRVDNNGDGVVEEENPEEKRNQSSILMVRG